MKTGKRIHFPRDNKVRVTDNVIDKEIMKYIICFKVNWIIIVLNA